mgnify:CR=1 FL=1
MNEIILKQEIIDYMEFIIGFFTEYGIRSLCGYHQDDNYYNYHNYFQRANCRFLERMRKWNCQK